MFAVFRAPIQFDSSHHRLGPLHLADDALHVGCSVCACTGTQPWYVFLRTFATYCETYMNKTCSDSGTRSKNSIHQLTFPEKNILD